MHFFLFPSHVDCLLRIWFGFCTRFVGWKS